MSNGGWNRGEPEKEASATHKPSVGRGAIAGLAVVAIAGIVAWVIFSSGDEKVPVEKEKKSAQIKEVTPAPPPKAKPVKVKPEKKEIPYWELPPSQTNGLQEGMLRKWKHMHNPPPCVTNMTATTDPKESYAIFNHYSENRIACYLTLEPGQTMIGTPVFGEHFEKDFRKSCEEPILITEEDDDDAKALKKLMNETKIELRQRMAAGEKIGDIMSEAHAEAQKLATVKREIENVVHEQTKEMTSEQDYDDLIKAANKMLEEKGIAPISANPIVRRNLKRQLMAQ